MAEDPTPSATGTPEATSERNRVTVLAAADIDGNGLFDDHVTIESPIGTVLRHVRAIPVPTDPAPPAGIFFPAGLFDYDVVVAEPGDPARVTFHLPDGTVDHESDAGFWVVQNGRWSDLTARADVDAAADEVTVRLVDGGAGDEDGTADGVIADPGGPGLPGDDWSMTITVEAPADPLQTFNYFLEECAETAGTTPCTPQDPRLWVDPVADGPTLPNAAITPVSLSHGQTFTWANLDAGRHYRLIEVGAVSPPDTGTGTPPAGWAITAFECDSVGATLLESEDNSITGFLSTVTGEGTSAGWATCTVVNSRLAEPRTGSTITARKWGDRSSGGANQPLAGATMGIWRDNGDGNFQPGGADGNAIATCVTSAAGTCNFTGLASGGYWVMEVSPPAGGVWNSITTWGPGAYNVANPPVPYAAHRYGDPAADLTLPGDDITNGYPIIVDGTNQTKQTDFFANRRTNPSIAGVDCLALLRVVLVLDRSGSIQENGPQAYNQAVQSFVTDLVGTNTSIGIASFSSDATTDSPYFNVLGGSTGTLLTTINQIYTQRLGGGTNWDAGLAQAVGFTPDPDLVILVTDGNPTTSRVSTSTGDVNWSDLTEAVTTANLLKSQSSRVIAIAAGAPGTISVDNLPPVSGPLTDQPSAIDDDYFLGTADELAEELRELALARCGASVRVKKEIETSPGVWAPGVGWSFGATVSGNPTITPTPPANTVLAGGVAEVKFEWVAPDTRTVTITEQNTGPAPDYFDPQIVCWPGPTYEAEGAPLTPTSQTARSVTFNVPTDSDYSCRFRNSPRPTELIVKKTVINDDGGTAVVGDFGITTSAGALAFGAAVENPADTFTYTSQTLAVAAGTYTLAELPVDGYTPTDWTCTNGDGGAFDGGSVTVAVGDDPVTCSITNDDQPVELIIEKVVINDDAGTATVDDFGITTSAGTLAFGAAVENPADTFTYTAGTLEVTPGTYTLAELPVDGYTPTDWTCTNGDGGAFDAGSVTLAAGDDPVTCSITNDDQPLQLTIEKVIVNNDGGTAVVGDFGITTSAGALNFTSDGGSPTTVYTSQTLAVAAGTYTLAELPVDGYTPTDWTCTNGDGGAFDGGSVTVAVGDDPVTCSITNDDQPVELIIEKVVINDDAGTATVDDFGITTSAGALTFGPAVEDPTDTFTYTAETLLVSAGTYTLSENDLDGYNHGDWLCTNGDGGAFDAGSVTVAVGDPTVTCSITNVDIPLAGLIIVKTVINDDGGTAVVDDFGITTSAGALTFTSDGGSPTTVYTSQTLLLASGTYTLAELEVAGYTPTDWTCDNGDGGPFDGGSVTVTQGDEDVTCSITNDDQPIELNIVKTVVNNDGGTATVDDFGITTSAGALAFTSDGGSPTTVYTSQTLEVTPGTYTLAELAVDGYTPTDWTCTNGDGGAFDAGSVTLAAGDDPVTCSITNDDQPLQLTIEKVIVNNDGGTAVVGDFGITTSAGTLDFGAAVEDPADTFTYTAETLEVPPGTHTLSELAVAGYAPTDWTCTNGGGGAFDGGSVTLEPGDDPVTCSITNNDFSIEVLKAADDHLIPPQGQDVTFTYTVTNTSDLPVEIVSLEDDVFGTLDGDADCQVGTILPPGGSCEFEETFFVKSDTPPNGDLDQVFPPHVNTVTACASPSAGEAGQAVIAAAEPAPPGCDNDVETINFFPGGDVLPDTAGGTATPGSSPSSEPRIPWLLLLMALVAIAAAVATVGRLRWRRGSA